MDIRQLSLIAKNAGLRLLAWNQQGPGGALPLSEILEHDHTEYAPVEHDHADYAPVAHDHTEYAPVAHTHADYAPVEHDHADYAPVAHDHADYAPVAHDHEEFLTQDEIEALPGFGGSGGGVGVPVGCMIIWPLAIPPSGWLICNGSAVSPTSPLYALGITVLPDLRGRVPVGVSGSFPLLSSGGAVSHALTASENGLHTHAFTAAIVGNPGWGIGFGGGNVYNSGGVTGQSGLGTAHNNMQPYLVLNYIIYEGGI